MAEQEFSPHHRADVVVAQDGEQVTLKAPAEGVTLTADEAQELASRLFEASALATGEDPEERDWVRLPMQYLRVAAERMDFEVEGETLSTNDDPTTRNWPGRRMPKSTVGSRIRRSGTRCTWPRAGLPNTGG
jgi:hypothetical protein